MQAKVEVLSDIAVFCRTCRRQFGDFLTNRDFVTSLDSDCVDVNMAEISSIDLIIYRILNHDQSSITGNRPRLSHHSIGNGMDSNRDILFSRCRFQINGRVKPGINFGAGALQIK